MSKSLTHIRVEPNLREPGTFAIFTTWSDGSEEYLDGFTKDAAVEEGAWLRAKYGTAHTPITWLTDEQVRELERVANEAVAKILNLRR